MKSISKEAPAKVKAYYKYELADLYHISQTTLIAWINRHLEDFLALGYQKNQKILSPAQVKLLFEKVGEP